MSESSDDDLFAYEFLAANNHYRRLHGVPELQLSGELSEMAQRWAEKLASTRHLEYFQMPCVGENITFFPSSMSAIDMIEYWYKECKKYEYEAPGWQFGTNYFTQIIWKSTREVGIGIASVPPLQHFNKKTGQTIDDSLNDHQVIVAFYRPSGNNNRAGQFAANVNQPIENESNNCR